MIAVSESPIPSVLPASAAQEISIKPEVLPEIRIVRRGSPTAASVALARGWLESEFADEFNIAALQEGDDPDHSRRTEGRYPAALFREDGNVSALWSRALRQPDTALIGLTWIDERQLLLAKPGADFSGPESLRGRKLGLSRAEGTTVDVRRAIGLRGFAAALDLAGIDPLKAEFVDIPVAATAENHASAWPAAAAAALRNGDVDVIYAKGASAALLQSREQLEVVVDLSAHPNPQVRINNGTPRPLTVDRAFLKSNPQAVARYLAVLQRAADWSEHHPEEVRAIVAAETRTDEKSVDNAYGEALYRRLRLRLTPDWISALQDQADLLKAWGLIAQSVDVEAWIAQEPLIEAERLIATGAVLSEICGA